ncbi:MAG: alpha/beta hydrolase [Thermoanaerobaculia bacterium]|nr:alpha/beta hydrolase [Thermoanaerobaculia bacterium]
MTYIKTKDEQKIYIKDWGKGRPVILLHGWPLSADTWDEGAMAIADAGFRAISYDRRGFGRSSQPFDGYDYDTLTDDLAAVIEGTGATGATIIGFSMGGGEVARYMSRHRGKNVVKAGLIGAVVPFLKKTADNPAGVDAKIFEQMGQGMKKDRAAFFGGFFKGFYGGKVTEEVMEWSRKQAMEASFKATLACANSFATTDFRPDLAAFTVPTLIIHGTNDKIVPIDPTARVAAKSIKGAKLIEYEGAPHGLFASDKDRLTSDLIAFLKS